jgi:hypothetical protein
VLRGILTNYSPHGLSGFFGVNRRMGLRQGKEPGGAAEWQERFGWFY